MLREATSHFGPPPALALHIYYGPMISPKEDMKLKETRCYIGVKFQVEL